MPLRIAATSGEHGLAPRRAGTDRHAEHLTHIEKTHMALELSNALSTYAVSTRLEDLSAADVARMVDAYTNWVGCTAGGCRANAVDIAARTYASFSPAGQHAGLGRSERLGLTDAISLDSLSSAVQGFDDTHLETILHPTGPVAAALLGLARTQAVSGPQFIEALYVGMEVQCRIGLAFASKGTGAKRGWYATGLAGGVGAAAAVGRILGFSEAQMRNAFGLAAARAAGNRGTHGTMAGAYVPSLAAESGFVAAKLTAAGFTCGARALDGSNGLLELVTDQPAIERALRDLGLVSEATKTAFKPYPAGIVVHPIIDACLSLVRDHGLLSADIERVDLEVPPVTHELGARKRPQDEFEAAVSVFYWAATSLVTGRAGAAEAGVEMTRDPRIRDLQDRIFLTPSPALADDQCKAVAKTTDGRTVEVFVEHAVGSLDRPMSSADLDAKFLTGAQAAYPLQRAERLLQACRGVLSQNDVSVILKI